MKSTMLDDARAAATLHRVSAASHFPAGGAQGAAPPPIDGLADEVVLLMLIDVAPGSRGWGVMRFVLGRWPLRRVPGLSFVKQLGSGHEGGFGLRPSGSRQGLFMVFDDEAAADGFLAQSAMAEAYRRHARELCVVKLRAYSSRGSWAGTRLALSAAPPLDGPIAGLTRASIRPARAPAFWRKAPPAQASLEQTPGCLLAVGLGEAPLLRQATFTVWESAAAMEAYARSGAHLAAIRAAHRDGYFSESMFVRFVPISLRGDWKGRHHG